MNHSPAPIRTQIGTALLAYGIFRFTRPLWPPGPLQDSFPSLLCPLVLLPCVELGGALLGATSSRLRTALCGLVAAAVLECAAPAMGRGTADPWDALAWLAGTVLHLVVSTVNRTQNTVAGRKA